MANIIGAAIDRATGKFLGWVDGKGRIRRANAKVVRCNAPRGEVDRPLATELFYYTEQYVNMEPFYKNLTIKKAQGKYDHNKAIRLMQYAAERGARAYAKEYGMSFSAINVPTRIAAAEKLLDTFESNEYPQYVPKKYRQNPHQAFNVYLNGKLIDTVFYSEGARVTSEEVKRSLVNHDGYDPRIVVRKRKK